MALTASELRVFRSFVPWDPPDDAAVNVVVDDLGSWQAAALEFLRRKRQEIASAPSSFTVPGEYSESWDTKALDRAIAEVEVLIPVDEGGAFGVGRRVRADRIGR